MYSLTITIILVFDVVGLCSFTGRSWITTVAVTFSRLRGENTILVGQGCLKTFSIYPSVSFSSATVQTAVKLYWVTLSKSKSSVTESSPVIGSMMKGEPSGMSVYMNSLLLLEWLHESVRKPGSGRSPSNDVSLTDTWYVDWVKCRS